MLGGAPGPMAPAGADASDGDPRLVTKRGLVGVGPGSAPEDGVDRPIDVGELDPSELLADAPATALGSSALASARELLDAAEAWRGRPAVPATA